MTPGRPCVISAALTAGFQPQLLTAMLAANVRYRAVRSQSNGHLVRAAVDA